MNWIHCSMETPENRPVQWDMSITLKHVLFFFFLRLHPSPGNRFSFKNRHRSSLIPGECVITDREDGGIRWDVSICVTE